MKLLESVSDYIKSLDWKEFALVKICLIAFGMLLGLSVSPAKRRIWSVIAGIVFIVTCVPVVFRFFADFLSPALGEYGNLAGELAQEDE